MSLKQLKSSETNLSDPEPSAGAQQKSIKNSWSFNLHKRVPIGISPNKSEKTERKRKRLIRKFYGKKILYVTNYQGANAIVSRSKLLKYVEVNDNLIIQNNLRSKGNLVIFSYSVESIEAEDYLEHKKRLLWKKILRNCQKAKIQILETPDLTLFKYLLAIRHLIITMNKEFELASVGGVLGNFLNLETLRVQMAESFLIFPLPKKSKRGFFEGLHKLSRLQKVKLNINDLFLQKAEMKCEIDKLYSQPLNFGFSITVENMKYLKIFEDTSLVKILNAAEYLSLRDWKSQKDSQYKDDVSMAKEEKKRMKVGSKNIVRIFNRGPERGTNVAQVLFHCDLLKSLYIGDRFDTIFWKSSSSQKEIKALQNLEIAVLEFRDFQVDYEDIGLVEDVENSLRPQRALFYQIKEKCPSLQRFAFYVFNSDFKCHGYSKIQNLENFIQEVSTFDKLKAFGIGTKPESLSHISLCDLLSNKNVESFQLKFSQNSHSTWDWDNCFVTEKKSDVTKFSITVPAFTKIPLFEMNLLDYIRKLDNLQIVELVDKNQEVITFDFLHGFVTSLLNKKDIRKILICTKVMNNFYSEKFGATLSKNVRTHLHNLLDVISQELEGLVNSLKDKQLEEILVGKLQGYSFDYLLYNKEIGVTEKLFWTQKEMEQLLGKKEQLAMSYKEVLGFWIPKETTTKMKEVDSSDFDLSDED